MNRIIVLLILVVTFFCKDENKSITEGPFKFAENQYNKENSFISEDLVIWSKVRVNLEPTEKVDFLVVIK